MELKTYLEQRKLSQEAFAARLQVSQGLVWQWLNGKTAITVDRARQIVRATGGVVTPHDLLPDVFPRGFEFPEERAA